MIPTTYIHSFVKELQDIETTEPRQHMGIDLPEEKFVGDFVDLNCFCAGILQNAVCTFQVRDMSSSNAELCRGRHDMGIDSDVLLWVCRSCHRELD